MVISGFSTCFPISAYRNRALVTRREVLRAAAMCGYEACGSARCRPAPLQRRRRPREGADFNDLSEDRQSFEIRQLGLWSRSRNDAFR